MNLKFNFIKFYCSKKLQETSKSFQTFFQVIVACISSSKQSFFLLKSNLILSKLNKAKIKGFHTFAFYHYQQNRIRKKYMTQNSKN